MNDNDETRSFETRSWNELAAECFRMAGEVEDLKTQLFLARATIADYERAHSVAEAIAANNDVLNSADNRARVYRTTGKAVEVDMELARHMFESGTACFNNVPDDKNVDYFGISYNDRFKDAIEEWEKQQ